MANAINNTMGSSWGIWDLHVHSPASILNNQFSSWDSYFMALNSLVGVRVLGITDYFSIEGYKRVSEVKSRGSLSNIDLVLPNVELRLNTFTSEDKAVNIHIIFSPEITDYLDSKFFSELEYNYQDITYKCTREDLITLGRRIKGSGISDTEGYKAGMIVFKVSIDGLKQVLAKNNSIFEGKYITIVANKQTDGASGIRQSSYQLEQLRIYDFASAIFSGNPGDRDFFLGKKEGFPPSTIAMNYGSLKPCIHGSDAHSESKICRPDQNRFTWIKAEPSFEGLKQVLHEPEERVRIQDSNPDTKYDYNIIKSLKFRDGPFTNREILLNPGLNAIIGGKSSGKSILLYKIAQSISKEEVTQRQQNDHWKNPYKLSFVEESEFEIKWRNNTVSSTTSNHGNITYIPQMYINALSEDSGARDLQEKIREILARDETHRHVLMDSEELLTINSINVTSDIARLFAKLEEIQSIRADLTKIGERSHLEQEKTRLENEIHKLTQQSSLTDEDQSEMSRIQASKDSISQRVLAETKIVGKGKAVLRDLVLLNDTIKIKFRDDLNEQFQGDFNEILDTLRISVSSAFQLAIRKFEEKLGSFDESADKFRIEMSELDVLLQPFMEKVQLIADITTLRKQIDEQTKLITQIITLEEDIQQRTTELDTIKRRLLHNYERMHDSLLHTKEYFNSIEYLGPIQLVARVEFNKIKFREQFISNFDQRGKLSNIFPEVHIGALFSDQDEFLYSEIDYIPKINSLLDFILTTGQEELKLRKTFSKQDCLKNLLNISYLNMEFDLSKDGDILSEMSPGKKGLVLLELFLAMSNDKHPILIDQPEDNLDNRTISTDLVTFLRKRKQDRQIIIVTHNANLVVLTDAENVIVANQDKQLVENESCRFEYTNGALECDFNNSEGTRIIDKGIKTHVCEILEGGKDAFLLRERKYGF